MKNSAIFSISAKEIFSQSSKVWGRSMLYLALKAARSLESWNISLRTKSATVSPSSGKPHSPLEPSGYTW